MRERQPPLPLQCSTTCSRHIRPSVTKARVAEHRQSSARPSRIAFVSDSAMIPPLSTAIPSQCRDTNSSVVARSASCNICHQRRSAESAVARSPERRTLIPFHSCPISYPATNLWHMNKFFPTPIDSQCHTCTFDPKMRGRSFVTCPRARVRGLFYFLLLTTHHSLTHHSPPTTESGHGPRTV
jgi:hypothetical protein